MKSEQFEKRRKKVQLMRILLSWLKRKEYMAQLQTALQLVWRMLALKNRWRKWVTSTRASTKETRSKTTAASKRISQRKPVKSRTPW